MLAALSAPAGVITLTFYPASSYNSNTSAMDAALGTTGRVTDTFESTTLLPGLSIVLSGGVSATYSSLPGVFDGDTWSPFTANTAWDGSHSVTNATGNLPNSSSSPSNLAREITFDYAPGASAFGIGLSNFQSLNSPEFPVSNHELFVNGIDQGSIETLAGAQWNPGLLRNAYLVITDTSPITSVSFENLNSTGQQDALLFDHLTLETAAPEPAALPALIGVTAALVAIRLRARRAAANE